MGGVIDVCCYLAVQPLKALNGMESMVDNMIEFVFCMQHIKRHNALREIKSRPPLPVVFIFKIIIGNQKQICRIYTME